MLLGWFVGAAWASGRVAVGVSGASGLSPVEPSWAPAGARPAAVGCVGAVGWWVTGGHDYAGPRGEVLRTSDDTRWGLVADLCPTSSVGGSGGTSGGGMGAYGRQWGGQLYLAATLAAGVSAYGKSGPAGQTYAAFGPVAKPALALGLALPPGLSIEAGPYAWIAPPLLQGAGLARPRGAFVGHVGLEATFLVGAASPQAPWR
ncbi:MAG: hypothetical protein ABMB14_13185 [Myxococcota bacterium]